MEHLVDSERIPWKRNILVYIYVSKEDREVIDLLYNSYSGGRPPLTLDLMQTAVSVSNDAIDKIVGKRT